MSAGMAGMPKVSGFEGPNVQPSAFAPAASPASPQQPSDQVLEATALAGSAAIRRIIAERNELRSERERLRGIIQELRRENEKATSVGDQYRQLATELLVQLKQMHQTIQEASKKVHQLSIVPPEIGDASLISLARRFAAPTATSESA